MSGTLDLSRIRAALAVLDAVQAEHPEALAGRTAEQWATILQEDTNMQDTATRSRATDSTESTTQVAIRLPDSMVAALDAYAAEHTQPGLVLNRSDAVRLLLARALQTGKGAK